MPLKKTPYHPPRKHTNINTYKIHPFSLTEEATEYYNRLKPEHKEAIAAKKTAKNKSVREKKNAKKARIAKAKPIDW